MESFVSWKSLQLPICQRKLRLMSPDCLYSMVTCFVAKWCQTPTCKQLLLSCTLEYVSRVVLISLFCLSNCFGCLNFAAVDLTSYSPITDGRRWATAYIYSSPVVAAYWLLLSAVRSINDSDWPVHCFMLFFHYFRWPPLWPPPSTVRCMVFGSALYQQTWSNHDNLRRLKRLTIRTPDVVRRRHWPVALHIR